MMPEVLHPEARLGKVSLRVSNLAESVRFYTEVVGLRLLRRIGVTAELTADGADALVVLEEVEGLVRLPEQSSAGLYHFAILVPDKAALGLVVRNLSAHRIPVGQGDHLVSEALYISDPDHNGIEIYTDRPRSTWQRNGNGEIVMGTGPVDVESLLAASEGLEWTGLPPETVIGHVHFHVSDLQEAKRFYSDILGFELTAHYGRAALFLSAGGYHHHIGLNVWAGEGVPNTPRSAAGMNDFTIELPDRQELEAIKSRILTAGLETTERPGEVRVADPSDIGVRFVIPERQSL